MASSSLLETWVDTSVTECRWICLYKERQRSFLQMMITETVLKLISKAKNDTTRCNNERYCRPLRLIGRTTPTSSAAGIAGELRMERPEVNQQRFTTYLKSFYYNPMMEQEMQGSHL